MNRAMRQNMPAGCGLPASGCGASAVPARNKRMDSLEQKLQLFLDRRAAKTPSQAPVARNGVPAGLPPTLPNAFVPSERLGIVVPAGASAEAQPEVAAAIREMRAALAARQARGRELIPDGIPDLFRTVADKSAWLAARPGLSGDALAFYNETPVCDVPSSFRTEAERVAFAEQLKSASTDATVPLACALAMIDATVSPAPSNPPMPQPDVQASPPRATPAASWRELTGGIQAVNASVGHRPPVLMSSPSDDQRSQQRADAPVPTGVIVGSAVGAVVAIGVGAGAAVMLTRK